MIIKLKAGRLKSDSLPCYILNTEITNVHTIDKRLLTFSLGIFFLPQSLHGRGNLRQISSWALVGKQHKEEFYFLAKMLSW